MTNDIDISPEAVDRLRTSMRIGHSSTVDAERIIIALSAALAQSQSETAKATAWAKDQHEVADRYAAALTQSRAETAAAYERAAREAQVESQSNNPYVSGLAVRISDRIRALATPEQSSALAAIEAAAEARGMRRAAELALQRKGDGTATLNHPYDKGYLAACDACAAAILADITKGAKA